MGVTEGARPSAAKPSALADEKTRLRGARDTARNPGTRMFVVRAGGWRQRDAATASWMPLPSRTYPEGAH